MENLLNYIADRGLQLVIIVKILVVLGVVAVQTDLISFGQKPIAAQDAGEKNDKGDVGGDVAEQTKEGAETGGDPKLGEGEPDQQAEETSLEGVDASDMASNNRKSFLEDLLNLPKLDPSTVKKEEIGKYLSLAERKKAQVEERIRLLEKREEQLVSLESTIDKKLTRIKEELQFFHETQQREKEIKKERLSSLVEFYKKMSPKKAAPVFEKMDRDLVVALFNEIPQKQIMNILSLMEPQKSVEISEYFGRIRSAKEYDLLKEVNMALRKEFDNCQGMGNQQLTSE